MIDYSGDAGNVVIGTSWSSWTDTQAVGHGSSIIQNCIPNCAQGTNTPVPTTIALSDPQGGQFTQITESRNGQTSSTSSGSNGWPLTAS